MRSEYRKPILWIDDYADLDIITTSQEGDGNHDQNDPFGGNFMSLNNEGGAL